jgi:hypothetical protein
VSDKGLLSSKTIGDSGCGLYACSIVGYRRDQGVLKVYVTLVVVVCSDSE